MLLGSWWKQHLVSSLGDQPLSSWTIYRQIVGRHALGRFRAEPRQRWNWSAVSLSKKKKSKIDRASSAFSAISPDIRGIYSLNAKWSMLNHGR